MTFIILFSLVFIGISFIVTEKNAQYLLSGYNTMSKEEKANVDFPALVKFFKKFHLILGISMVVICSIIYQFIDKDWSYLLLAIFPIVAYIFLISQTQKFDHNPKSKKKSIWGIILMLATLLFVGYLFFDGNLENKIIIENNELKITESYGETIPFSEIQSIHLVDEIPPITIKTNGFALSEVKKGYFKTETGEKVKLILNAMHSPYILITKKDGKKIYFSTKKGSNTELFESIKIK